VQEWIPLGLGDKAINEDYVRDFREDGIKE
jgi:hypothetical protein